MNTEDIRRLAQSIVANSDFTLNKVESLNADQVNAWHCSFHCKRCGDFWLGVVEHGNEPEPSQITRQLQEHTSRHA